MEQAPKAEAWSIEKSIWRPRLKESDARAFVDTPACLERMCEADWKHAVAKEKFSSMLSRENKGNKVAAGCVHAVIATGTGLRVHSPGDVQRWALQWPSQMWSPQPWPTCEQHLMQPAAWPVLTLAG